MLILSCGDHIIRILDPNDLAANAWKKLQKQYGKVRFSARHLAFQSLISTHISFCDDIDQFRSNIKTLAQMTTSTLPQWLLLSIFINNVSSQYEAWAQSLMQQIRLKTIAEDSQAYLDEVIASLIDEARRTNTSTDGNSTAMIARKPAKSKPICDHCGKVHKSENCWQKFPYKKPSARLSSANQNVTSNLHNQTFSNTVAFLSQNRSIR